MSNRTVKGALLLAGLMLFAGNVSALESSECARYVKKTGDSVVLRGAPLPTGTRSELAGFIDANVLDWDHGIAAS